MFIDPDIQLVDMPARLENDFKELQKYYDEDNWYGFMNLLEITEATSKAFYHAGKISLAQLNSIFRKYGIE